MRHVKVTIQQQKEIEVQVPQYFKTDFCHYMTRDDGAYTRVWLGTIQENTSIDIQSERTIDWDKIKEITEEQFFSTLNDAMNILAITSRVVAPDITETKVYELK